ncbi:hypothetical protein BLNAU_21013 [Blattamonas nauphoetae]|uniref:Uncharacterized protein n=1 Tax=Blattamonas nauphoetae TaxID=2049346 RepID=A0ABQ9WY52_9EUKA|nr:hypothetical protein BLNAU_21013 [Blattamonas nauphoetae]
MERTKDTYATDGEYGAANVEIGGHRRCDGGNPAERPIQIRNKNRQETNSDSFFIEFIVTEARLSTVWRINLDIRQNKLILLCPPSLIRL